MAVSTKDIPARLKSLLPAGWFANKARNRHALVGGIADALSWIYDRIGYAKAQTRLGSASGFWLDLFAWDFFQARFMRRGAEADDRFRSRIKAEIFRPRSTRAAITQAVTDLVGTPPQIFEPWNPGDCGAYDVGTLAYAGELAAPAIAGYDTDLGGYDAGSLAYIAPLPPGAAGSSSGAGCYGSYGLPNQIFVKVQRPTARMPLSGEAAGYGYYDAPSMAYGGGTPGMPQFAGYDTEPAGFDQGGFAYIEPEALTGYFAGSGAYGPTDFEGANVISDEEIYATVAATKAAGVIAWVGLDVP